MKFGSWTYDGTKINLTANAASIDMGTYQPSGEWEILGVYFITALHCRTRQQRLTLFICEVYTN